MSFNFFLFRGFRLLLFPFSFIIGIYIKIRNFFYDKQWLKASSFNLPMICIGNLSVGGTGKSPMTEYMLRLLSPHFQVAILSRGYKRKTSGYVLAGVNTTALEIGDEPMQFFIKFPDVAVAVGEERVEAVPQLLQDRPATEIILLDDAFQHRKIKAGFNILLTDFSNPYWQDWFLPSGDLRDEKKSAQRADVIIVTKCPKELDTDLKKKYLSSIKPLFNQAVFFTEIVYGVPYHLLSREPYLLHQNLEVLLVCGIANPLPLKKYLEKNTSAYFEKNYDDHHIFSIDDLREIQKKFKQLETPDKIILTTEKDAVRLLKFGELLKSVPIYVMPIRHQFLFNEREHFDALVSLFIDSFNAPVIQLK